MTSWPSGPAPDTTGSTTRGSPGSPASAGLEAFCGGTCNETDRSAQVTAHVAMACWAGQVLAKPGMGVDEGLMIVGNEMACTAAVVRAREAARRARA